MSWKNLVSDCAPWAASATVSAMTAKTGSGNPVHSPHPTVELSSEARMEGASSHEPAVGPRVRLAHQRWAIEQHYQELNTELGFDAFRSPLWAGNVTPSSPPSHARYRTL